MILHQNSKKKRTSVEMGSKQREERVNKLTGLERLGKAAQALITPGVAADTPQVQAKMKKKFPPRRREVRDYVGGMPEATAAELGDFVKIVRSFNAGTGPGPTGLRVQSIRELIGEDGADPCAEAVFRVVMLFVEGEVPNYLRSWYGGGTLVGRMMLHWNKMPVLLLLGNRFAALQARLRF